MVSEALSSLQRNLPLGSAVDSGGSDRQVGRPLLNSLKPQNRQRSLPGDPSTAGRARQRDTDSPGSLVGPLHHSYWLTVLPEETAAADFHEFHDQGIVEKLKGNGEGITGIFD